VINYKKEEGETDKGSVGGEHPRMGGFEAMRHTERD